MTRNLWLCLALVAGRCLAAPGDEPLGQPFIPAGDEVVLQQVPTAVDPRVRRFEALRAQWQKTPDMQHAAALSRAYLDYGRDTGDARYLGRAEAVIEPWLKQSPPPLEAKLIDATILQSRHQFADSEAELIEILKRDRDNGQAWLTLATVAQVQGDMGTARHACAHLMGSMDALITAACLGGLDAVNGHPREGYQAMQTLLQTEPGEAPAIQSWVQGLMADAALYLGDEASAESHYRLALQLSPGDNFLLADYADFLLDRNRPQEAAALLKDYTQSDTSFLRLCMAEQMLHLPQAAADAAQMASRFAATDQRGSYLYRREEALFALRVQRDAASALNLAQENWTVQKAPQDVRILLEAAQFAGKPAAAQPALDFIDKTGLREPHIDRLAGDARKALQAAAPAASGAAR